MQIPISTPISGPTPMEIDSTRRRGCLIENEKQRLYHNICTLRRSDRIFHNICTRLSCFVRLVWFPTLYVIVAEFATISALD